MQISFVDLQRQYLDLKEDIHHSINAVVQKGNFIMGEDILKFENEFSKLHNAQFGIGTSSGTSALFLSLKALGIKNGDEVIIPANTFIATSEPVSQVGATPVFVDVEDDSYNIDPEKLEGKINKNTQAIIAVHLYGRPADMDKVNVIAQKYNLKVVEDAAQAHVAQYKSKKVGTLSDVACFSFFPSKNLGAYGDAGMVLTNNKDIAEKVSMLRNHGRIEKYEHVIEGYNERMDTLQAAILRVKLKHLENWTEQRREHARLYNDLLKNVEEVTVPRDHPDYKSVYHLYVIRINNREKVRKYLGGKGVATGVHYPIPLHLQPAYSFLGYKRGDFQITEAHSQTILSLPLFPELTKKEVVYIVESIKKALVLS